MTYDFATRIKQIEAELAALKIAHASGSQATVYDSQVQIKDASSNNIGSFTVNQSTASNITIPSGSTSTLGLVKVDSALSSSSSNPVQNSALYTALGAKADTSSLATVATTGAYSDLTGQPTIPTVSATQVLSSGTKIGTVTVNGTDTDFYAPSASGSKVYYAYDESNPTSSNKTVTTLDGGFTAVEGVVLVIYTDGSMVATDTINVDGTGAIPTYNDADEWPEISAVTYVFKASVYGLPGWVRADYNRATISEAGWAKLEDSTSSTSTSTAATPNSVKTAYDLADSKSEVTFSQTQSSGTPIGDLTIDGSTTTLYAPSASAGLITFGTDSSYWYFDRNTNQGTTTTVNLPSADINRVESSYSAIFSSSYSGTLTFGAQLVVKNSTTYFRRYGFRTGSFSSGEGNYNAGDATFTTAFVTGSGNWNRITYKQTALRIGTGNQWMLMVDVAASGNATTEHYDVQCETTSPTIAPGVYVRSSPFTPSSIHREGSMWVG